MSLSLALVCVVVLPTIATAEVNRIVSLAPSVTEILFALGVGPRVVGISTYCDFPPETATVDRVGTFLTPNVELILAKRPDLVIGVPSPGNRQAVEAMQGLGLNVLIVNPESVASILEAIRAVAAAVGVPDAGAQLVARIEQQTATITQRIASTAPQTVLMVVDHNPLITVGRDTYQDELIRLARGVNVGAKAAAQWPHIAIEFAIAAAPEVIIDTTMGKEDSGGARTFWGPFTTIPAVRNHRIFGERAFVLLRPGPRVAEALEMIARFLHPERFA